MQKAATASERNIAADPGGALGSLRALLHPSLAPLFWRPERVETASAWWAHVPFAHWLVLETTPRVIVELGTPDGVSYSAFCEAVLHGAIATRCHGMDTWRADKHANGDGSEVYEEFRRHHDARYGGFSTLFRGSLDEAIGTIADGSADLLHIHGLHTYEAVSHAFERWLPKLSKNAVVLLHDTNERRDDFGVWRLWEELTCRYPGFEFLHGHGLGVLAVGEHPPDVVAALCGLASAADVASVRSRFAALGERFVNEAALRTLEHDTRLQIHRTVSTAAHSVSLAQGRAEQAERAAAAAAARAAAIEGSTIWRATGALRVLLERFPGAHRATRAVLRASRKTLSSPRRHPTEAKPDDVYERWVREHDTLDDSDRRAIRAHIAEFRQRPLISVVVPAYNTNRKHLEEMITSVLQQLYPHWELCIADDASPSPHVARMLREYAALDRRIKTVTRKVNGHVSAATNSALELATGEFVALLDHDDVLSERALYEVAAELNAHTDAQIVYSDSDYIDDAGRRSYPYFKTDWDPDLMLGHNLVSHIGVYRRSLLEELGGLRAGFEGSQDYDLMLRAAEIVRPGQIRHIPGVLYHWRRNGPSPTFSESSLERCVVAARRAIRQHLERSGTGARVEPAPKIPSLTRVAFPLPATRPLVTVIVPTRDRADLLARCADGVLTRTDYDPLELIIVDNDSKEPETFALLERLVTDPRVKILRHEGAFNVAALNNRAVREARGEIVVLLNNDVEVKSALWLEEMVSQAIRPEVGAVGAMLLYPDGRVQHAGVVLGVGDGAGNAFDLAPNGPGYFGFLALTRRVSAVTAACMALRRSTYLEVRGLDDANLPSNFSDVDLCLRLGERGYGVVWTPHAELWRMDSASRGSDTDDRDRVARVERDADFLKQRWPAILSGDPHYNVNLSIERAHFEPAFPPRRRQPWLQFKQATEATSIPTREQILVGNLDPSSQVVEIGPSFSPLAPKAKGWNTTTVDHATRAELIEKYRGDPTVDVNRIEDVDCVWTGGSLADAVPAHLHGTFDALIASHVIEHTTDFVGFLDAAAALLANSGIVILAVPDKRYCFDYFRPLTTTGDVLEAHTARRSRHTRRTVFNHRAYVVKNAGSGAWGQGPVQELAFFHSVDEAMHAFANTGEGPDSPYIDSHAWQFTPASFELMLLELARIGETERLVDRITPTVGCEFYAWLRRGGRAAAALTVRELQARRLELLKRTLIETREQIDRLVAKT